MPCFHPQFSVLSGMIGYGLAKAAVHQLVKSLAAKKSGLPAESYVGAILPWVLRKQDDHFNGLVQERRNSIANTLELCLFCTN